MGLAFNGDRMCYDDDYDDDDADVAPMDHLVSTFLFTTGILL